MNSSFWFFFLRNHFLEGDSACVEDKQGLFKKKKDAESPELKRVLCFQFKSTIGSAQNSYASFKTSTLLRTQNLHFLSYHEG